MTEFRPTLVQTIVQISIDMTDLEAFHTLEQCLKIVDQSESDSYDKKCS